jgi:hypothetical protein
VTYGVYIRAHTQHAPLLMTGACCRPHRQACPVWGHTSAAHAASAAGAPTGAAGAGAVRAGEPVRKLTGLASATDMHNLPSAAVVRQTQQPSLPHLLTLSLNMLRPFFSENTCEKSKGHKQSTPRASAPLGVLRPPVTVTVDGMHQAAAAAVCCSNLHATTCPHLLAFQATHVGSLPDCCIR